jgi:hypothetical protein
MKFGTISIAAMLLIIGMMSAIPMANAEEDMYGLTGMISAEDEQYIYALEIENGNAVQMYAIEKDIYNTLAASHDVVLPAVVQKILDAIGDRDVISAGISGISYWKGMEILHGTIVIPGVTSVYYETGLAAERVTWWYEVLDKRQESSNNVALVYVDSSASKTSIAELPTINIT